MASVADKDEDLGFGVSDLLDWMEEDDLGNNQEWAKHVEDVARANTSPAVRKKYRNALTRFV